MLPITIGQIENALASLPRTPLAYLPTPLDEAPRLTQALGGPRILIKRDDLTGLALGGNKARKLEFLMADALAQGADCIVTSAAAQSNIVRSISAAAAKLGLEMFAVLRGEKEKEEIQGNLLLDYLFGAKVIFINTLDPYSQLSSDTMESIKADLQAKGRRPYIIDGRYQSAPLAAVSFVAATIELQCQLEQMNAKPTHVFLSTGSGTTQAGICLGTMLLGASYDVVGISVQKPIDFIAPRISEKATSAAALLGLRLDMPGEHVIVDDGYIGDSYGVPTAGGIEAMKMIARTEGLIVDPVYTSKGLSGLIGWVRQGKLKDEDTVVFWHTGGVPALFAKSRALEKDLLTE
jgi:D-cysteine desulfhydrase family pyridoxal phosphate-dependent enzyme